MLNHRMVSVSTVVSVVSNTIVFVSLSTIQRPNIALATPPHRLDPSSAIALKYAEEHSRSQMAFYVENGHFAANLEDLYRDYTDEEGTAINMPRSKHYQFSTQVAPDQCAISVSKAQVNGAISFIGISCVDRDVFGDLSYGVCGVEIEGEVDQFKFRSVQFEGQSQGQKEDCDVYISELKQSRVIQARQLEGQIYTGALIRTQQAFYLENSRFTDSLEELQVSVPDETENYQYSIQATDSEAIVLAQAKNSKLRSFKGVAWIDGATQQIRGRLCITSEPGMTAEQADRNATDRSQPCE